MRISRISLAAAAGPSRSSIATSTLDQLLQQGLRPQAAEATVVRCDGDSAGYLRSRFWTRLSAGSTDKDTMHGLSYTQYTDVRRGVLDVLMKLRHHSLAGPQSYLMALSLSNKLNYRAGMAARIRDLALQDGVACTPEMHLEILRAAKGTDGGIAFLADAVGSLRRSEHTLTPSLTYAILNGLLSWGSGADVFRTAAALCGGAVGGAVPYAVLLSACSTPGQALALLRHMEEGRVAISTSHRISALNTCVRAADPEACEAMLRGVPDPTPIYYERLMSAYKEAGCVAGVEAALLRATARGLPATEGMALALLSAYALRGDRAGVQRWCARFPEFRETWPAHIEMLLCEAVRGDAEAAGFLYDARPQWGSGVKHSAPHLARHLDACRAARIGSSPGTPPRAGSATWEIMSSMQRSDLSYAQMHALLRHSDTHNAFGLRALSRAVQTQRKVHNTGSRAGRRGRSALGDLHSVVLDERVVAVAVAHGRAGLLRGLLGDALAGLPESRPRVPHVVHGLMALSLSRFPPCVSPDDCADLLQKHSSCAYFVDFLGGAESERDKAVSAETGGATPVESPELPSSVPAHTSKEAALQAIIDEALSSVDSSDTHGAALPEAGTMEVALGRAWAEATGTQWGTLEPSGP